MTDNFTKLKAGEKADICFVLEGTYPYVLGGVSNWVHQLISNLPQYRFAVVFIGSASRDYSGLRFELPANLCHLEVHYLSELSAIDSEHESIPGSDEIIQSLSNLQIHYLQGTQMSEEALSEAASLLNIETAALCKEFGGSQLLWDFWVKNYKDFFENQNFSDYFWALRSMYLPLLGLLKIADQVPEAACFHSVSTGYAGALATFLRVRRNKPLILTEHGIYTKERRIDIYRAALAESEQPLLQAGLNQRISMQRRMWIRFFEDLGRLTYSVSSAILTLYQANQQKQLELGAPVRRCKIIPNGIALDSFRDIREIAPASPPRVIALIGRVVRIKDIKTFIRTVEYVVEQLPDVEGWIIGPEDEDPDYVQECKLLVNQLGLQTHIKFKGFSRVEDILPQVGLMVLTSISEGQPLVMLESFAAGVPVVTTDVGACRELIEGRDDVDKKLGSAGRVVPIANPKATANAIETLLTDDGVWQAARQTAMMRVEAIYSEHRLLQSYQYLYDKAVGYGRNRV